MTHTRFGGRRTAVLGLVALLALPFALSLAPAQAEDEEPVTEEVSLPWVRNYVEAKQQAAKEGKDLLINFTGSDWCVWCMRLEEQVFSHAEFVDAATKKFVFVFMDKPNSPELKKAIVDVELRDQLMQDMGVAGFPTIILAAADGTPYARTGYKKGGPEVYLTHLDELQAEGAAVKKMVADTAHADKVALAEGLKSLAKSSLLGYPTYLPLLDAAEKADADGSLGLKTIVEEERARQLSKAEERVIKDLLPPRGEQPDWEKLIPAIKATKHLEGFLFLQLCFGASDWLIKQERGQDAKDLLEFAKRDKLLAEHAQAKKVWEGLLAKADALLNPEPATDGGEGEAKPETGKDGDK